MQQHIIEAAVSGDATALEHIYKATIDRAYAIAFSIVKDEFEAQDITQEAYITVFQKLSTVENTARVEAWIATVVRNKAIDYTRKNHPELFSDIESSVDDEDFRYADTIEANGREYYPDEQIDQKETKRLIWEIIDALPDKQRQCIVLRYQEDLKIKDIAIQTGMSEATVKSCLKYAHGKIEAGVKKLEKEGTKLYSFTPLTLMLFLRWLLGKRTEDSSSAIGIGVMSATKAGAGEIAGAKAVSLGKTVAGIVQTAGKLSLAQKIGAVVLAATATIGSVAGIVQYQNRDRQTSVPVETASIGDFGNGSAMAPSISESATVSFLKDTGSNTNGSLIETTAFTETQPERAATPAPTTARSSSSKATEPESTEPTPSNPTPTEPAAPAAALTISTADFALDIGESKTVDYSYTGVSSLVWSSSQANVVTVSNGTATAVGTGTATITVSDGTLTSEVTVTVTDANDLFPAPDYKYINGYSWNGEDVVTADGEPVISRDAMEGRYYLDPDNVYGCYSLVFVDAERDGTVFAIYLPSWWICVPDPYGENGFWYANGYDWDYPNGYVVDAEGNVVNGLHEESGEFYFHDSTDVFKYTRALLDEDGNIVALDSSTQTPNPQPDPNPTFEYKNGYSWSGFGYRTEDMPEFGETVRGDLDESNIYYFDGGTVAYTRVIVTVQGEVIAVDPASKINIKLVNGYSWHSDNRIVNVHGNGIYTNTSYVAESTPPFSDPDDNTITYTRVICATSPYADDRGDQTEVIAVDIDS